MSEPTAAEREERLVKLRRRMGRALKRGESAEYERLSAVYVSLKAEHVTRTHEEYVAERRAVRAAVRAQERSVPSKRWRLPYGFSSPLAAERARSGWRERREPSAPAGGLNPWRRGSLAETRIWRP